eukprot:s6135_g3.t1
MVFLKVVFGAPVLVILAPCFSAPAVPDFVSSGIGPWKIRSIPELSAPYWAGFSTSGAVAPSGEDLECPNMKIELNR